MPDVAPYGSWKSPITAELIVSQGVGLGSLARAGDELVWLEKRSHDGPRVVLVAGDPGGAQRDLTPAPFDVKTRVHEYGGGAYLVAGDDVIFSHFDDQRLYRTHLKGDGPPTPLTPEGAWRFADGIYDQTRDRIICVREDHNTDGYPENTLVSISLNRGDLTEGQVLVSGADFFSSPRLSPDGSRLVWISWDHPSMPWDGSNLWMASIGLDGSLGEATLIAGGPEESVTQPRWSPRGLLHFVSDRTGWWNIFRLNGDALEALCTMEAEFCDPPWSFGSSNYTFTDPGLLVCAYLSQGHWTLARIEEIGGLVDIPTDLTTIGSLCGIGHDVYMVGESSGEPSAICIAEQGPRGMTIRAVKKSRDLAVSREYLSEPEHIRFVTTGHRQAFALFYPPTNPEHVGPADTAPPLLVISHGGPTASASSGLNLSIQFWTSRGFAVVDVDYGGSTGYGRLYRGRLRGQWGVVDVDDCVRAALYLVEKGRVDKDRLAIRGGSAGGYTTLGALTFRDTFHAGASYYGLSDLEAIVTDTHKFESRYVDGLVAPLDGGRNILRRRSPIHAVDRLSCPVIFFQGLLDPVVPPDQSERMYRALVEKGIPTAYLAFEGEYHGLRKPENASRALLAELYFYGKVFGFEPSDTIEAVAIENL